MAQFYNKILKKEEELAGYNVGEPDDDIFKLGDSAYPGDIEKYLDPDPVIEIIPEIEPEAIITEYIQESDTNIDNSEEFNGEQNIWDDFDNSVVDESSVKEEDLLHNLDVSDNINNEIIDTEFEESDNINQPSDGEITFDDEFKKRLAAQIRPEKDNNAINKEAEPADLDQRSKEFKPVEEIAQTKVINISDFDITRPSEKVSKESVVEEKVKEPEKKKKRFPFLLVGITAASIIILSTIAFLYFDYVFNKPKQNLNLTKVDSVKKEVKKERKKADVPKSKVDSQSVSKKIDTVKEVPHIEKKPEPKIEVPAVTKIEKKPIIEKHQKIVTEKKKEEKPVKALPEKVIKKLEPVINPKKVEKKEKIVVKNTLKEKNESKPKTETVIVTNSDSKTKIAVYTVQVYSSPSKDDALEWFNKLKGKNISDAFISEQMVRDVKWYRVRFGQFESREDARSAALRYGFAQTWIDRVK